MKFLETISTLNNDVLVPINRIKYINSCTTSNGYLIKIVSDDGDWTEFFDDTDAGFDLVNERYEQIKQIVKGA